MAKKPDPINVHLPNMPSRIALTHDADGLSMEFEALPGPRTDELARDFLYAALRMAGFHAGDASGIAGALTGVARGAFAEPILKELRIQEVVKRNKT